MSDKLNFESLTHYQKQLRGNVESKNRIIPLKRNGMSNRIRLQQDGEDIDEKFGFVKLTTGDCRTGWLLNFLPIVIPDENGIECSGLDLYFIDRVGESFKATLLWRPYFFVSVIENFHIVEVSQRLQRKYEKCNVEIIEKEDLDMPNHLCNKYRKFVKLSFNTVSDLVEVRGELRPIILQNAKRQSSNQYVEFEQFSSRNHQQINRTIDPLEYISDMKEYDVPYHMRVAIDCDIRVGAWFSVTPQSGLVSCLIRREIDKLERCDLRVLAFDIECEKAPLKFPDASKDRIYMISYMMSGRGYLLINREVVSEDVQDFEYTPTSKYPGPFEVCNEPNEEIMLRKFIHHIQTLKPHVISTYNGDFFDWPFLETRLGQTTGLSLYRELGIRGKKSAEYSVDVSPNDNKNSSDVEYVGRCIVHLDAFCWVKRDSYLPQGNQGLKAVTKYKLGYDPVEVDPEDMLRMAQERPTHMASYSVSDAVATYYLYDTYVHNFIFSLSTIIPMGAEEVLRKGSGTLCEALLMVEAYKCGIICPNKQTDSAESFHNGHFLDSETYIGGHVECLEAGVFRADIPCKFSLIPSTLQNLIDRIDRDLVFALENENDIQRSEILNYDEVRQCIVEKLEMLRDFPRREEPPLIYHLDVGAMYPNIILTNRLQPNAMVTHNHCASCDFNLTENDCRRKMTWTWRGEYFPPSLAEYQAIKKQLEYEKVGDKNFTELSESAQISILKSRLKSYSNRVYKRSKQTEVEDRINTVCMRENPFYVNTVRAFRDRRYEYKLETKKWKTKKNDAEKNGDFANKKIAEDKEVLMDSLQLAHKCILNSFYGYVMRKGARWRSMEMAGIVTYTGAELIKQARELVENVGRPLELDTDGIWCILPKSFPQEFKFKINRPDGTVKFMSIDYPCAMLNADVHDKFTNHQYQDLVQKNSSEQYASHSECSIYFELDGPYKAMILPASPEEGKLLKKKYVVFNFDDSIAELKGFEIKRRGELELIKIFQGQVFDQFLNGTSLRECYDAVASVANKWLDILFERGRSLHDDELMELISEKKTISKTLEDYEGRKATSLTTAARLADFLGEDMVKDKGLNCNLIISCLPHDAPVAERAIPVAIFAADESIKKHYLRKWTKDPTLDCSDFRNIIDWSYYIDRLGKVIQKIITIPAGMQGLLNPCPRIDHPIWLRRKLADLHTRGSKQLKLTELFKSNSAALSLRGNDGASFRIHSEKASESSCRGNERTNKAVGSALSPSPAGKKRPLSMGNNKPSNIDYDQFENIDVNKCGDISSNRVDFGRQVLDIEDIAGLDDRGTFGIPLAHKSTSKQNSINNSTSLDQEQVARDSSNDTESEITKHIIFEDLHDQSDLTIWLKNRKMSWRNKRLLKQTIKKGQILKFSGASSYESDFVDGNHRKRKPMGVTDMLKNASLAATLGVWQILELQETDTLGEFMVWAMTGRSQLQKFRLVVPRILYVNSLGAKLKNNEKDLKCQLVVKDLPHAKKRYDLYELSLPETKYQNNERASSLLMYNSQVEGVYESSTPLLFRAILKLGCSARFSKYSEKMNPTKFNFHDLEFLNVSNHPYLTISSGVFRRIYCYCVTDRNRQSDRGVLGLFILDETFTDNENIDVNYPQPAKAYIWISSGRKSLVDSRPPMARLYRKFQSNEKVNVKFTTNSLSQLSDCFKACNDILAQYLRQRHGPTLVIAQGSVEARQWRRHMSSLHEFPLATIPMNSSDDLFPAIGWQMFAAERLIQRYLFFPTWFKDRLECARYAHIPVCNLGMDAPTTMTDVMFARQLQHNRHLLWCSEGTKPDLGTSEALHHNAWSEPLREPVLNQPGSFSSICVELDLFGLDVAAILQSGMLDTDGLSAHSTYSNMSAFSAATSNLLQEVDYSGGISSNAVTTDTSCGRAFSLLKALIAKLFDDAEVRGNVISDSLLKNLYRYLCGFGNPLMNDPALHQLVFRLKCRLFTKFLSALRKIGVILVFADFSKIILSTNKHNLNSAYEYVGYITEVVREDILFSKIEIVAKTYWEQLLWMSAENWAGIKISFDVDDGNLPNNEVARIDGDVGECARTDFVATESGVLKSTQHGKLVPVKHDSEYDFLDDLLPMKTINNTEDRTNSRKEGSETYDSDEDERYNNENDFNRDDRNDELFWDSLDENVDDEDVNSSGQRVDSKSHQVNDAEIDDPRLDAQWNIAKFLPSAAAQYFYRTIEEFIFQQKKRRERIRSMNPLLSELDVTEMLIDDMKKLIHEQITRKLLKVVEALQNLYGSSTQNQIHRNGRVSSTIHAENAFPIQAGSHLKLSSPALEFVKMVTHVLALDPNLQDHVSAARRLLLAQLRVREFDQESRFLDPCLSYVVRDVICGFCYTCRDMDLLRDPVLSNANISAQQRWICSHCSQPLDHLSIESMLVDEVGRITTRFLLQDFRCSKNNSVSTRLCATLSDMSASLKMDVAAEEVENELQILRRVAKFHNFDCLLYVLETHLNVK